MSSGTPTLPPLTVLWARAHGSPRLTPWANLARHSVANGSPPVGDRSRAAERATSRRAAAAVFLEGSWLNLAPASLRGRCDRGTGRAAERATSRRAAAVVVREGSD